MSRESLEMTKAAWPEGLTDEDVCEYLKAHPDFLMRHPKLFTHLQAPGQDLGEGVVDFQQMMLERLKLDKAQALELQQQVVEIARANLNNQSRIHSAVLSVLEAQTLEDFIESITQDFSIMLDVDVTRLVFEVEGREIPHIHQQGVRIAPSGFVESWLGDDEARLAANTQGDENVFGPAAGLVKSYALISLEIGGNIPRGLLAFGSRDPEFFTEDQGIEQITFLAQVVERCMRLWLILET